MLRKVSDIFAVFLALFSLHCSHYLNSRNRPGWIRACYVTWTRDTPEGIPQSQNRYLALEIVICLWNLLLLFCLVVIFNENEFLIEHVMILLNVFLSVIRCRTLNSSNHWLILVWCKPWCRFSKEWCSCKTKHQDFYPLDQAQWS